ncbi:ATP-binding protein [Flavobacterium sp. WC2430]|uniref:tetratricopeptide repeat-containing hybrid sensor histidine kinase/response regulator n=1 Tax=Flavobacterium sp. WC2430 TaxID=3234137 RepID=UPI0034666788
MKYFLVYLVFFNSLLYSQTNESKDSIEFYTNLAHENIKNNKYKNALFYTQKAINFSETSGSIIDQANQTFKLGEIYYTLKKYNDAIEIFSESIALFETTKPTLSYANTYYYLGLSHIGKSNYSAAEICFNKAQSIYKALKIDDYDELINLQKGIILKNKGNKIVASSIFNTIIAKPDNPAFLNTKAEASYQIGLIEEENNRNNLALTYYNKALELNSKQDNLEQKSNILLALSSVYEKMLDKSNAYTYLKQHLNLKESIAILNNEKLGIDDYENFKETQRLKKIEKINKQNLEKAKTNKFSKLINILSISLISILSLLSLSLYKNNIIRNKSNLLLKEKNNELLIEKEKTEKASKARSEFLSTVSHELRTPLNAINGITHLLLEENPKKSQLHYLSSLKFSGNYLATFINEILEINKIDSNKVEIEYINFNIKNLLEDIKNSLKGLAKSNNIDFTLEIDSNIPDNLIGDPTKLSQIFMNLINNALKFTKDGKVNVSAKMTSLENKNAVLCFKITDTGIGIPKDKQKTVFESFSQGSVEINRKYGGTGLGLTIVKKLIKILGGQIKLESELGKGSKFSFDLSFKVDDQQLPVVEKQKMYEDIIFKDKNILLVEDNKINQMITQKMLEYKGVICKIIDNGEDAIESVKNNQYDLVLMDVHLPGINGTIATQKIREFNKTLPIIALTAISLDENREMLLSYGMNDVITKPFVPEEFYASIANNLSKSSIS